MKARIRFSPQARTQARNAARWWREHRPRAPRLFAAELRGALMLLGSAPGIGVSYPHPQIEGVRRLLLSATRYHVYYVHDRSSRAVEIVAIWSAVRRRGPNVNR